MNPFTTHPQEQGVSYMEHWRFAMGIVCRLFISVVAFTLHATLPFIPIAPRHDLEKTSAYLTERNQWIETANKSSRLVSSQNLASSNRAQFDDIAIAQ